MGALSSKRREYKIGGSSVCAVELEKCVEKVVCKENDLQDGSMAEFDLGENKILLVKENGVFTALGSKCTHYGAPLKNGVLLGGKIRCPWHGACFDSQTGDIEDFPGLDSLPCYQVSVVEGDVKVKASLSALKENKRMKPMTHLSADNSRTFVIIGGGSAAQTCCETLRQQGFSGKIILISQEKHLPYDRPKLSKVLDSKASALYLRSEEFYKMADISLNLNTVVTGIETEGRWVICDGGKLKVKFDKVMIATGGKPITLDVPGSDLDNIFYLRTPEDGNKIAKGATGKSVVIFGTSFIGMEVASYLLGKASAITVIGLSSVPFSRVFGKEIGTRIKALFESKGVKLLSDTCVKFDGLNGKLTSVELASGEKLSADLCVIGIGVKPATDFLKDSGIALNSKGQVIVNELLETNIQGIFAAGDIVEFPLTTYDSINVNICHWQIAASHGHTAAFNMLGKNKVFHSVPVFWSQMCGKTFRYAGYANNFEEVIVKGDLENLKFIAYYIKESKVVAVCTCNKDPEAIQYAACVNLGESLLKSQVA